MKNLDDIVNSIEKERAGSIDTGVQAKPSTSTPSVENEDIYENQFQEMEKVEANIYKDVATRLLYQRYVDVNSSIRYKPLGIKQGERFIE